MWRLSLHRLRWAGSTCYAYNLERIAASLSFQSYFFFLFSPPSSVSDTEGCSNKGDPHWPLSALCSSKDGVCLHHLPHPPHDTNPGEITPNKEECGKKRQRGGSARQE